MKKMLPLFVLMVLSVSVFGEEPSPTLLWPEGAPGAKGETDADKPALFFHRAPEDTANGACVLICPGGGYRALMMSYEGHDAARWLNSFGVSAAVLRSRIAPYQHPAPMQDVQQAMLHLRTNAEALGIDARRIGVMGFSAGGHLAGTATVHHKTVGEISSRPDFSILVYPVLSMVDGVTHAGSRQNLLGENPDPKAVEMMSLEKQVTKKTPPTFLFHTGEDKVVPAENSVLFYSALRKVDVPAELHIYRAGGHGVGLDRNPATKSWPPLLKGWMQHMGYFEKK